MNWIELAAQLPERDQRCIVYAHKDNGFYAKGIYIARYLKNIETETFFFRIEDGAGEGMNSRSLSYFSHWMPIPEIPTIPKESFKLSDEAQP